MLPRPFAVLAVAALALVGLVPTASAADAATIDPIAQPVGFYEGFAGDITIGYTCTVPTTAPDALDVHVSREILGTTLKFKGIAPVTCDGSHRTVLVELSSDGNDPLGQQMQPGPGRAQVSLQGTQIDTDVSIIRTDGDPRPPVVTPLIRVEGDVVFTTATRGSVQIGFQCNEWASGVSVTVQGEDTASGDEGVACAQERTVTVPLTAAGSGFSPGRQTVRIHAELASGEFTLDTSVDLVRGAPEPPAPVKKPVALTTNASPEKVKKGRNITVRGTVRRDGSAYEATTVLQFAADGHGYRDVKTVRSNSEGALKTKVRATRSGKFRYTFAGDETTLAGTSPGDHIVVKAKRKPKPKAYSSCAALAKVYPHGVGRPGARDKGSDVTDFTRDRKAYAKNTKLDRGRDGIACER